MSTQGESAPERDSYIIEIIDVVAETRTIKLSLPSDDLLRTDYSELIRIFPVEVSGPNLTICRNVLA